jgi:hypothetical protein
VAARSEAKSKGLRFIAEKDTVGPFHSKARATAKCAKYTKSDVTGERNVMPSNGCANGLVGHFNMHFHEDLRHKTGLGVSSNVKVRTCYTVFVSINFYSKFY